MPYDIKQIKEKLKEVVNFAYSKTTHGGFFNLMYNFVEIIEKDPIMSKFIKNKIDEYYKIKKEIDVNWKNRTIHETNYNELYGIHVRDNFYHDYYSWFKTVHDVKKRDKCGILGKETTDIDKIGLFLYDNGRKYDLNKQLIQKQLDNELHLFKGCYKSIINLINSNSDYFDNISNARKEKQQITYNYNKENNTGKLIINKFNILFAGKRAIILNRFYEINNVKPYYKTYKDLKETTGIKMKSDQLRRDVADINRRVRIETDELVKQIIKIAPKKTIKEINKYKWQIKT